MSSEEKQKFESVREQIANACRDAGRSIDSIRLIAVSKKQSEESIRKLASFGQVDFGENYMQEALKKIENVNGDLRWHFIGALQSNKAKLLLNGFHLFHGLDRISLATEINRAAENKGVKVSCLVQVNIDDENTKSGLAPSELPKFLENVAKLSHIEILGLMSIPSPEGEAQKAFASLRELMSKANQADAYPKQLHELSMGMSGDFADAIREGSTMIRVGTALFGARQ